MTIDAMPTQGQPRAALLLLALFISTIGDEIAALAIIFQLGTGDEAWLVPAALLAQLVPLIVLAPVAGLLIDKFDTGQLLRVALLVQTAALAVMTAFPTSWCLIGGLLAVSCVQAVISPAIYSLLPVVAEGLRPGRANAVLELSRSMATLGGPLIAGVLIVAFGTRAALAVDVVSFAVALAVLTAFPICRQVGERCGLFWEGASEGFAHLWRTQTLRPLVPALAVTVSASSMINVASVFYVVGPLGAGSTTLGIITAAWGVGAIVGGLFAAKVDLNPPERYVPVGTIVLGVALTVWALSGQVAVVAAVAGIAGIGSTVASIALRASVQARTPPALLGRAHAAAGSVVNSFFIVGYLAAGAFAASSPGAVILVAGAIASICAVAGLFAVERVLRRPKVSLPSPSSVVQESS